MLSETTVLRLGAFDGIIQKGPVLTRTYLFPKDVRQQNGAGQPDSWGMTNGQPVRAYYRMASAVLDDPRFGPLLEPALRALPSLSVVMSVDDLFGLERGIYAHPQESGAAWERPASLELLFADGTTGFQVDCGIRIQGGWNRRPEESPKHAFRLVFNRRYGEPRLVYPLFGNEGVGEFKTLVLRAGCNNTWLHWSGEERHRGDYLRDQWLRDTQRAMGHPSARGQFVHLYLNGVYWGIYNLTERPSAEFVSDHLGGSPKDYDSRNGNQILEGSGQAWDRLMRLANAGVADERSYEGIKQLVDVPQFIDYMIANLYGANADWDGSSNWYAARRRRPPGPFQFFVWDGERTLEQVNDNTLASNDEGSPTRLFHQLKANPQFCAEFSQHVHRHLLNGGALTPEAAAARYRSLAEHLDLAIVAESARWGSYRRDVHSYKTGPYELYTRDDQWRPEVQRLLNDYFPKRTQQVLQQFQAAGLYQAGTETTRH